LGAIPLHGLKEMLRGADSLDTVVAHDLVDDSFGFMTPTQRLADAMEQFWRQTCERLPVVDDATNRKLVGWISKRDLIGVYNQEILQTRQLLGKFSMTGATGKTDSYMELPEGFRMQSVDVPQAFAGRSLKDLALRSTYNVHVLQIAHITPVSGRSTVEMPDPDSALVEGDRLIVVGMVVDIARLMADMAMGIDNQAS
jgi:CBS domain-containing protein